MREFKVGDKVTAFRYGTGAVVGICGGTFPIDVQFDAHTLGLTIDYTSHGQEWTDEKQSLYHADPEPAPAPRNPYTIPATASQEDKVLAHLFHVGSISPIEAQELCGSMCLAQRIYNIKKRYDIHFVKTMEPHTLPNGHKGFHTRYSLPESVPYEFQRRAWDLVGVEF